MENVTYICNKSTDILRTNISMVDKFVDLTHLLEKESGVIIAFCEIIVSRWKYLAGSDDFITPIYKYSRKDSRYGIMVQEWGVLGAERQELIDVLLDNINLDVS